MFRIALVFFVLAGCATTPRVPPQKPEDQSSVDALLGHMFELRLTDLQLAQLKDLERVRKTKMADAVREMRAAGDLPAELEMADPQTGMTQTQMQLNNQAGLPNQNANLGGPGGMAQPNMKVRQRQRQAAAAEALEGKIDQLDFEAYYAAEALLTAEQKPIAQKYATAYRAALYTYRDKLRAFNR